MRVLSQRVPMFSAGLMQSSGRSITLHPLRYGPFEGSRLTPLPEHRSTGIDEEATGRGLSKRRGIRTGWDRMPQ
jgi:hypothetical protein